MCIGVHVNTSYTCVYVYMYRYFMDIHMYMKQDSKYVLFIEVTFISECPNEGVPLYM